MDDFSKENKELPLLKEYERNLFKDKGCNFLSCSILGEDGSNRVANNYGPSRLTLYDEKNRNKYCMSKKSCQF